MYIAFRYLTPLYYSLSHLTQTSCMYYPLKYLTQSWCFFDSCTNQSSSRFNLDACIIHTYLTQTCFLHFQFRDLTQSWFFYHLFRSDLWLSDYTCAIYLSSSQLYDMGMMLVPSIQVSESDLMLLPPIQGTDSNLYIASCMQVPDSVLILALDACTIIFRSLSSQCLYHLFSYLTWCFYHPFGWTWYTWSLYALLRSMA